MVGERVKWWDEQLQNMFVMEMRWIACINVEEYHHHVLQIKFIRSKCQTTTESTDCVYFFFFFPLNWQSLIIISSARAHIFVIHRWRWMMHTVTSTDMLVKMYLKLVLGCISLIKYAPIFLLSLYPFVLATCYWYACTWYFEIPWCFF